MPLKTGKPRPKRSCRWSTGNAPHDLNPLQPWNNVSGPRVLRAVTGDFVATVTVAPFHRPGFNSMAGPAGGSFIDAGLVVWIDDTRFLRFFRNAKGEYQGGIPFITANWYFGGGRTDGKEADPIPDNATSLKVEREGHILRLSYRAADGPWKALTEINDFPLPTTVKVGVAAMNTTTREFAPKFDGWKIAVAATPPLAPFDAVKAKEHQDAWADHLGVKPEITNSIGMKLRLIPPGEFMMGSSPEDVMPAIQEDIKHGILKDFATKVENSGLPQHKVRISRPYFVGACEVTVGQFQGVHKGDGLRHGRGKKCQGRPKLAKSCMGPHRGPAGPAHFI